MERFQISISRGALAPIWKWFCFVFILEQCSCVLTQRIEGSNRNEEEAKDFQIRNDFESSTVCNSIMEASWSYHTNVTEFNRRRMVATQLQAANFRRRKWREASRFQWSSFQDHALRRLFSMSAVLGSAALSEEERLEYAELLQSMREIYSEARICPFDPERKGTASPPRTQPTSSFRRDGADTRDFGSRFDDHNDYHDYFDDSDYFIEDNFRRDQQCRPTLKLEPDLIRIMAESRNPDELLYVWREWRNAAGRPIRRKYLRFIKLANKAARLNGFNNTADYWKRAYESEDLEEELDRIWEELRPLYEQLHAYVRRRLKERYGDELFNSDGTIPAHLLGNMWGQSWVNLLDITVPYPGRQAMDVTPSMVRQGYTPARIFRVAEDFFTSLGFPPLPLSFWVDSMLEKPRDRDVVCHATAWDFCNRRDYRIKQCTEISMKDLVTAHHEMGHIYYGISYRNQPLIFREGANPGFHEAIGDAIALSVTTPSHLQKIGLLGSDATSYEDDINSLFTVALDKIAFLPFGFLVDKWRWNVFSREVPPQEMNNYWWQLKVIYQGISPPIYRSPLEFDPGAKYHVPEHVPYIRYFIGYVLQFQIHDELCRAAGHRGPLHKCDIYGSKEAGLKLERMLSLGRSQPWRVALSELTDGRSDQLDARPLLRYFRDLNKWLVRKNREEQVGWETNQALFTLTGALVNTSSATFIGILIGALAALLLLVCLCVYCYRRINAETTADSVAS